MKAQSRLPRASQPWMLAAILPLMAGSPLHGEIKGEKLGDGFVRTTEEPSEPAVNGFVKRDGKRYGKIDAFTYSSFISAGNKCSFVPTDAILYVPEKMKGRVSKEKTGKMVLWPTFYRVNRSYYHTVEVSPAEYTGKTPISEKKMKQWESLGRIVVAVYRGNPISVPKPKTNPEIVAKKL